MGLKREIRKYIESELRDYDNTKKEWEQIQDSVVNGSPVFDGQPRGTDTSAPAESKAMKLLTNKRLGQLERTIKAFERVIMSLPEEKFKLVVLKYWTRPQYLNDEGIAQQLCCSRRTLYDWLDGIILALAKEMGLVD